MTNGWEVRMLNTAIAMNSVRISHDGRTFSVKAAGVRDDRPYAVTSPLDPVVQGAIERAISKRMPPSYAEIAAELRSALA